MTATTVAVIAAPARGAADRRRRAPGRRSRSLTVLAVIIGMIPIGFGATPALAAGIAPAALWRTNGQATPRYATWDGASFGGSQASANVGEFRIMQGAESPSRDEAIVVGVDTGGTISGEMWNGSAWAALPALGTTTQNYWWGFDVAYEPVSGDAVVVYADGANLNYRVWDGSTWSGEISIPEPPGGTPRQMQLAAHPYSDEMVLIVSNDSSQDYAVVWDGSTWGNAVTLSAVGTGNDRTDVNVAYEQQSGDALVVYGLGASSVSYRTWNGSAWSGETSVLAPGGVTGVSRWTTLASNPLSDQLVMGVVTYGGEIWMQAWSGNSWISPAVATSSAASTTAPVVAAAFEGTSGQALVAYSMSTQNAVQYRTWSSGGGWSGALSGPGSSEIPNSVMLYPEPSTDGVMLAAQDAISELSYTYWDGGNWGPRSVLETNSGDDKNQPFLFLWPATVASPPPTYTLSGTVFEDIAGDVLSDGAIGDVNNPGVQDSDVHLYLDVDGDGVTEATDTYVTTVPTDANGDYSFPGLSNGKYFVVVDSKTVRSTAPALSSNDVWAEQTYGPAVSECADGSGGTVNDPTPGSCYGGRRAGVSDNLTTWYSGSEHLAKISIASADKSNIDFGFSFNVVTSTAGGNAQDDEPAVNNRSVQGSLRQFITNANTITGANVMRFVPAEPTNATDGTNDWWRIVVTTGLPPVDAPQTTVDGTAYDFTDGTTVVDPNPTTLGTGGTVGVDGLALPQVAGPELELLGDMVVNTGLGVSDEGDNSIVRRLAISRFQFDGLIVTGSLTNKLTGVLVEENVIGSGPSAFVDPGAGNRQSRSLQAYHTETSGTIRNNLIGFGSSYSVAMTFSSRDLTFEGNEIGGASAIGVSVSLSGSQVSGDITLRGNLIGDTFGSAVSLYRSYGSNTLENNTITNSALNSAVNVHGAGNRITKNVITGNGGAAIAVAGERPITAPTWVASTDNLISQNIFGNNGGLAIDLVESTDTEGIHYAGDGITLTAGTIDTTGNNGVDAPVISTASVTTVTGTACTNCDVEVYKAIAGAGDGAYGEGVEFVGTTTADGSGDWTLAGITTLTTSDKVTSIAIDGSNDTSEFGFNAVVVGPLIVNSTGDQSDIVLGDGKCYAGVLNSQGLEACTMRAAIQEANALAGADTIEFGIPVGDGGHSGGVWTITPGSVLPTISTTITIDGTTQPGWSSTPVVELNGISAGGTADGFTVTGDNVEIRSLAVNRFGDDAFNVDAGASGTVIAGNHIGTDPSGLLDLGNGGSGIDLGTGSGPTLVGGTAAADRNIISGNGNDGIIIFESDGNTVVGNYIGTDITGNAPLPNAADGIALGSTSSNNTIGQPGSGNVLSGNTNDGLELDNDLTGNVVQSNIIGLGADGATLVPNGRHGLVIYDGVNNTQVGGTGAGEGNLISGNTTSGVVIDGNANLATTTNALEGNYIGTDVTGTLARGNLAYGIHLFNGANGNTIGGAVAGSRNIISGNGTGEAGVFIDGATSSNNVIRNNYIGTDVTGTVAVPNNLHGIIIDDAPGTQVLDNLISGNDVHGVYINETGATGTQILRNTIGTDLAATAPLPNGFDGVRIEGWANGAIIGSPGNGNVIAGNTQRGINLNNSNSNTVQANSIGTNAGGLVDLGNTLSGIYTDAFGSSDNLIGGDVAGEGNTIAFNGEGITFVSGTANAILGNSIYANDALGIDLEDDGVTPNDVIPGDGDSGPNDLLNFPVITSASEVGGTVTVDFDLDVPDGSYRVEFFDNSAADGSGNGEGETWVSSVDVSVTGGVPTPASHTFAGSVGDIIAATTTEGTADPFGSTSEFSAAVTVIPGAFVVNSTGNLGDLALGDGVCDTGGDVGADPECTLRAAIGQANALPGDDVIHFDIPLTDIGHNGGVWTIAPGPGLPPLSTTITLDGTTQPGYVANSSGAPGALNGTQAIMLDGSSAGTANGLQITGNNVIVRGFTIGGFDGHGILVGGDDAIVTAVYVGTNAAGTAADANTGAGIYVNGARATIGGSNPEDRLLLSGNDSHGIDVSGNDVDVLGGIVGLDAAATTVLPNGANGVRLSGITGATIGAPGAGNVISGNNLAPATADGIYSSGGSGHIIQANLIGTNTAGASLGNYSAGVAVSDGASIQIGGSGVGEGNTISANGAYGVVIRGASATGNTVAGNIIGLNPAGDTPLPNVNDGVRVENGASNNTVGGTTAAHGNVISGNGDYGVHIFGTGTDSNTVSANYIGLDGAGTADLGNGSDGVAVRSGAQSNTIGGLLAGERNYISGNDNDGVWITGSGTELNAVQGNWIGYGTDGSALGNSFHGVAVEFEAANNLVGGDSAAAANRIGNSGWDGIAFNGGNGAGNAALGNSIVDNTGLGIDIDNDGVTPNDLGDVDTGDNDLLNFPVITSATETAGTVTVDFDLDVPDGSYRVEFFDNTAADGSGNGEGETWASSIDVSVTGGVPTPASHAFAGSVGDILAATATEGTAAPFGSTSEFSAAVTVVVGNNPPVFDQDLLDRVDAEASWISLSSAATDPDVGDTLSYSATGLPLGLSIDPSSGLITGLVNYYAAASSPYSVEITVDDGNGGTDTDMFTWTTTNVLTTDPYVVANTGGAGGGDDLLAVVDPLDFDPVTNEVDIGIGTGTVSLHGLSIEPISGVLFAADGDRLGTLNLDSGVFTAVGGTFGSGDGDQGTVTFDDVRGLTFQPLTGRLFALHHQPGDRDLLFVVDTVTGLAVPNMFAGSRDYVELRSSAPLEATDIALDPSSWQIYGAFTDGLGNFELRRINRWNGATGVVGPLTPEIRGLSFDSTGQMWGTDGGALYQINKSTAAATNPRTLDNGSDYQAVALAIPPFFPPSIEGTIFEDVAGDAVPAGEFVGDFLNPGFAGATVRMYRDDGSVAGEPDAGDTLWSSKTTGPGGHYFFSSIPAGVYWLTVDSSTLVPTAGGTGWADQTYGPAEAVTFDGSYSFAGSAGPLYGGMRSTVSDDAALLPSSEHVVRVDLSPGEEIEQVDLGFSFNVVTNLEGGDATSPQGSLRQFITNANTGDGPNPMRFVPAVAANANDGGTNNWWSLAVTSSLPTLTGPGTTIDGSAFDAADGVTALNTNVSGPELELEGSGIGGYGLQIAAGSNQIRELVVNRFGTGLAVLGGDANVIAGNYLGPDATGSVGEVGNSTQGIYVNGATNTVIGGSVIFDRNVISGNRLRGMLIEDVIGGPAISDGTQIVGNYIGTNATGSAALPYDSSPQYQQIGVAIWAGPDNVIGTATSGNVISGNSWHGVYVWGADASGNKIQGNTVGLDASGSAPVPNGSDSITRAGVHISSAPGNLIGGIGAEGNVIVSNAARGVVIFGATAVGNAIIGNTIYDNGDIGIDLQLDGVTLNDPGDADNAAANDLLNFPEITSALDSAGIVTVLGTFDLPAGDYRFEFFVNPSGADSSGFGEGQSLVHSYAVVAHPGGSASFSTSFAGSVGDVITATATEDLGAGSYGSTSEFSLAVTSSGAPLIVNSTGDASDLVPGNGACDTGSTIIGGDPECTLRAAIEEANDPSTPVDTIWFAIPATDLGHAAGVWTISPGSELPEITATVTLDATTQPGWSALPVIEVDGSSFVSASAGIRIGSSNVVLRGLAVGNFTAEGISVAGDDVTIAAMNVGVGADGSTDTGNGAGGIVVTTGDRVTIGGSDPLDRNIIGNSGSVAITVNDSDDSVIRGNYIGIQVDGVTPAPNSEGIHVSNSANLQIGGAGGNDGNVISGNTSEGIRLDTLTDGAQVRGNLIGVGADGSTPVGNGWIGVYNMTGSTGAIIGGRSAGEANTIAHNGSAGVRVLMSAQLPQIVGNRIHDNAGLGIDVGIGGVTPPDPGDVDGHPNQPVLLAARSDGGSTTVDLAFDRAAGDYLIDFYSNPGGGDPSGYGEGAQLIATVPVTHDGSGSELLRFLLPGAGSTITATATSATLLETSEFSNAIDDVAVASTLVSDSSIRRSDLYSAQGTPTVVPGVAGGAHDLDGVSEHLVGPSLDVTDSALTISGWVQLDTAIGQHSVISKRDGSGNVVYELGVDGGTSEAVATVRLAGVPVTVRGGVVSTAVWQQLGASWDGAELVLYVDGAEVDRATAVGTLATDTTTRVTIGARDDGTQRLDGRVDHVSVGHDPLSAAEVAVNHVNVGAPAVLVTLGDEQTGVPGAWTATTDQSRSGSYSLTAPETAGPATAAWAVATGIDEPGLVFESWWWMTTATGIDFAAGTRAGPVAVDQYSGAGVGSPFAWELRHPSGTGDVIDGNVSAVGTTGAWVKVEMWTDQLGDSRLVVDGVEMIGWTAQGAGLASGSAALLVNSLPNGEQWHVDDPRARKLVTPEPVASLGPLERG